MLENDPCKSENKDLIKINQLLCFYNNYIKAKESDIAAPRNIAIKTVNPLITICQLPKNQQGDPHEVLTSQIFNNFSDNEIILHKINTLQNSLFGLNDITISYCKNEQNADVCASREHYEMLTEIQIGVAEVRKNQSFEQAIKSMEQPEILQKDDELHRCRDGEGVECKEGEEIHPNMVSYKKKTFEITNSPYLIIFLKLYEYVTLTNPIKLQNNEINIRPSNNDDLTLFEKYDMFGCIVHIGTGSGGHYVAYLKVGDKWFLFDDHFTRPINNFVVQLRNGNIKPILFFYKNRNIKSTPDLQVPPNIGLSNLGNTCYLNALLQVLVRIPEYFQGLQAIKTEFETSTKGGKKDKKTKKKKNKKKNKTKRK